MNRPFNNKPMSNIEFFVWLVAPLLICIILIMTLGKSFYKTYQTSKTLNDHETTESLIKEDCYLISTKTHALYPKFFGDSYTYRCKDGTLRTEKVLVVDEYIETKHVSKYLTN